MRKKDEPSIFMVVISCLPLILIFSYAQLVEYGFIDPYANQRFEFNFTIRSVRLWEDPRLTRDRLLVSTYGKGVFFMEGNISCQLNVGDTYRIVYKNIDAIDIAIYHVFTIERIEEG